MTSDPSGNGYLLPDGRLVSIDDADAMFTELARVESDPEKIESMLWGLVQECVNFGKLEGALAYLDKILALTQHDESRASCFLKMGQVHEKKRDYQAALDAYSRAFALPQQKNDTWYLLNNNRAYCLNQLGRHGEAEAYCRQAIAIEPGRHNAHKNLGVCLQQKGELVEAAQCFLEAARIAPEDPHALDHLEALLARHSEVGRDHPEILEALQRCSAAIPGRGA